MHGRSSQLAVKPPRPPVRQCRSPRSEGYDNTASTFSFPVPQAGLPPNVDEGRWTSTGYTESSEHSPAFPRWVPARRQRSVGTSSSKQLAPVHHAASRRDPDPSYPDAGEEMSLQGDLSVCIGLTVQCSPVGGTAAHTSAASFPSNNRRHLIPRCGAAVIDPSAVLSWRNSHPMRLGQVRSCDDVPDYRSRWQAQRQANVFRYPVHDGWKYTHDRRSHPPVGPVPGPQRALGGDFQVSHAPGSPPIAEWRGHGHGPPSFEDFAVGFENDASTSVPDDLGDDVRGQTGFLDENDEVAFDEITQQIASLTQTVNDLRFKHRRPVVTQSSDDSVARAWSGAVFRRGGNRKQR